MGKTATFQPLAEALTYLFTIGAELAGGVLEFIHNSTVSGKAFRLALLGMDT